MKLIFMSHFKILSLILAATLLSGCIEPSAEETTPKDAKNLVDAMTYVKAKNGLCFGVATTSRISTNATVAMNNLVVAVDCSSVSLSK